MYKTHKHKIVDELDHYSAKVVRTDSTVTASPIHMSWGSGLLGNAVRIMKDARQHCPELSYTSNQRVVENQVTVTRKSTE